MRVCVHIRMRLHHGWVLCARNYAKFYEDALAMLGRAGDDAESGARASIATIAPGDIHTVACDYVQECHAGEWLWVLVWADDVSGVVSGEGDDRAYELRMLMYAAASGPSDCASGQPGWFSSSVQLPPRARLVNKGLALIGGVVVPSPASLTRVETCVGAKTDAGWRRESTAVAAAEPASGMLRSRL